MDAVANGRRGVRGGPDGRTDPPFERGPPAELTSFVGRRHELGEVKRLLAQSRLVTLTGMGGIGKTRLAGRIAVELRRAFPDGVWFVDLTSLQAPGPLVLNTQDPDVLAYLMMVALGLPEGQAGGAAHLDRLVTLLRDRQVLLILDNCEHLIPACAAVADALLRGCPGLRMLATGREPLALTGEVILSVPPLTAPGDGERADAGALNRFESVALFVARVTAVTPGFALGEENASVVAELCRRLDG